MFRGYWIAAIALGLVLASSPLLAQPQPQEPQIGQDGDSSAENGESQPAYDIDPSLFLGIEDAIQGISGAIEALESPEPTQEERQQAAADLHAQKAMAFWALVVGVASALTVLLTAMGVFLIWRTLEATKDAAVAAKSMVVEAEKTTAASAAAVAEANRTNVIAIENARAEQRPWLRFELSFQSPFGDHEKSFGNFIQSAVVNDGASPALDVCWSWSEHIRVLKDADMSELFARLFERIRTPGTEPGEIIYPTRTSKSNLAISFKREEYEAAAQLTGGSTPRLWVAIGVIYRDRHRDRWYKTGLVYELLHIRKSNGHIAMPNPENMTSFENGIIILSPTSIALIE